VAKKCFCAWRIFAAILVPTPAAVDNGCISFFTSSPDTRYRRDSFTAGYAGDDLCRTLLAMRSAVNERAPNAAVETCEPTGP
jgi:hypothetical protein